MSKASNTESIKQLEANLLQTPSPLAIRKKISNKMQNASNEEKTEIDIMVRNLRDEEGNTLLHKLLKFQIASINSENPQTQESGKSKEFRDETNKTIDFLIDRGLDLNAVNNEGLTALGVINASGSAVHSFLNVVKDKIIEKGGIITTDMLEGDSLPKVMQRSMHRPVDGRKEEEAERLRPVAAQQVYDKTKEELRGMFNEPELLDIVASFKPAVSPTQGQLADQKRNKSALEQAMFGDLKNSKDGSRALNSKPPSRSPAPHESRGGRGGRG